MRRSGADSTASIGGSSESPLKLENLGEPEK
jgi:hypothetical protein